MKNLNIYLDQREKLQKTWDFGVSTCHAPLLLRDDLQNHLKIIKQQCGFKYVRFHSVLNDDMETVQPDGSFNFDKAIAVYRNVLALGFTPFVEISSMPSALASADSYICEYKFRNAPPADWEKWKKLVTAFTSALTAAFGEKEVRNWYFEVWNEPDISFWSGTQEEYFKLYDITRNAVKSVCSAYRVGGPATSKTAWIGDFCDHVSNPSEFDDVEGIRCDFISSHAYPSDLAFLNSADGEVKLLEADVLSDLCTKARRVIDEKLGSEIPFIFGEWNSSAGPYAFNHDECNNAPFICKTVIELNNTVQGAIFWNASDIYEEGKFHYTPFHGGYGIVNVNDIPKSSFHAFRMLNQLSGEQLGCSFDAEKCSEHGAVAAIDNRYLRIIVWNYRQPGSEGKPLAFTFKGLPAGTVLDGEFILPGKGSAFETWCELGSPDYINRKFLDILEEASIPAKAVIPATQIIELAPGTMAMFSCKID